MYVDPQLIGNPDIDSTSQNLLSKYTNFTNKLNNISSANSIPNTKNVCIYNKLGQRICYSLSSQNKLECDKNNCKISYRTTDRTHLSHKFPNGIRVGLAPHGAFASLYVFGVFSKKDLPSITNLFGETLQVDTVDQISPPTFDLQDPPKSCRWRIGKDECQPYVKDLRWKWNPIKGWKFKG